ncbi:MAG: type VI secretion system tip protein VgrG [Rhodospirillales bacterium]|nr:type VI secretion system tip protein VgrG [Rhodospirillales bacterium]
MPEDSPTRAHSSLQVTTPLGTDALLLQGLDGEEHLSAPFTFLLNLSAKDADFDLSTLVGAPSSVKLIDGDGNERFLHGIVTRANRSGIVCSAELRPWLWLLTLSSGCRIFQNMSLPDIVCQVFTDHGFTDYSQSLTTTYPSVDYCVQYRETAFDFVSRLMEEAGIAYFFQHSADAHRLVLVDDPSGHPACPNITALPFKPLGSAPGWLGDARIESLSVERNVGVTAYQADDYSFETPSTDLKVSTGEGTRQVYEYPGLFLARDAGEQAANRRMQAFEAGITLVSGTSPVRALSAGCTFTISEHPSETLNSTYLLRTVRHTARQNEYTNSFVAQAADVVFRPPRRTPRPVIAGSQTAVVTGSQGQEIWTDQYGRIKVQFHWDQVGQKDENSSCWVRISQNWAGASWGAFTLPRIGQEVVVSFLDGDPDRPLVTGCVYNGDNPVPYTLPDEQTKTTLKSNSSAGGGGSNELRFEDKAGSEEIFVHAQKDLMLTVENDRIQTINHDDTATIKNDRAVTISEGSESLTVSKGDRTIAVETGKETHTVKSTRALTVTGAETHTNDADFTHKVTGNFTLEVDGSITIKAGSSILLDAGGSLTMKSGTNLTATGGTSTTVTAGTGLTLTAGTTAQLTGSASGTIDGGGMLELKGGLVKIN